MKILSLFTVAAAFCATAFAADIYVDYEKGNRKNPGTKEAPLECFARAINKAKAGDTVYILPSSKPINDTLLVRNKKGVPGKPIIVDGMNNIFIGTKPLDPKAWKEVKPGYFSRKIPFGNNMASRYYMTLKGKSHRMGRFTKSSKSAKFKKPEELQPGEWTLVRGKWLGGKNKKHPLYEFEQAYEQYTTADVPEQVGQGEYREGVLYGYENNGAYSMLRSANIDAFFCGHDHINYGDMIFNAHSLSAADRAIFSYGVKSTNQLYHDTDLIGYKTVMLRDVSVEEFLSMNYVGANFQNYTKGYGNYENNN